MLNKGLYIWLLLVAFNGVNAQEALSLDDAIKSTVEKNFAVSVSRNEKEIAKAQNNFGNAGMSPQVSLNGNLNLANLNSHQEFSNGTIQDRQGAQSNNTGASLNVAWTIFDGMKMFAVKKRLNANEKLSDIQLKQQLENSIYSVIIGYYDVVRIQQLIKTAQQNLSIYEERLKLAKLKLDIGSDSKVDLLLTELDANKAKSDILKLEQQLLAAKVNVNVLMNRAADVEFTIKDSISLNYNPVYEDLKRSVVKSNSSILLSVQNEAIAEQSIREIKAARFPQLQLNASYNFVQSQSQAGFVYLNRQSGINAGLTAGWLLFNGNKNSKLIKERQIRLMNQKNITEINKQQVDALVYINYQNYLTNKRILELETTNLSAAEEVLSVSMERYKIGKANLLETKEVQKNREDAQVRFINALYECKKSETELLRSNGGLVK